MKTDFFNQLDDYGSRVALSNAAGKQLTYQGLAACADRLAKQLRPDTLVFNFCDNNFSSVSGYLAFLRNGNPQALLNPTTHVELVQELISSYRPSYLWSCTPGSYEGYQAIYTDDHYTLLAATEEFNYPINPELALLLTTSGSTGSPKFVRQSHRNIAANARSIADYLQISAQDKPITTLPMSYTFGLSIINSHLLCGSEIVLNDKSIIDKGFWDTLHRSQATTFSGVPFTYEMLKKLKFAGMELPHLNKLTQAGGKLSDQLCHEFADICNDKRIRFFVMYGQTEATARISYLDCSTDRDKIGSVGKAIPGGRLSLIDDQGNPIEDNDVPGELIYQGENVTLGYATGYRDLQLGDENRGRLHTGDVAQRDADGFFFIVGRKKRFLKLFGNRVNLDELEGLLRDAGLEAACTGKDDQLEVYTVNPDSLAQVKELITNKLGISHKGFKVNVVTQVPRTESGKIEYAKLPITVNQ